MSRLHGEKLKKENRGRGAKVSLSIIWGREEEADRGNMLPKGGVLNDQGDDIPG